MLIVNNGIKMLKEFKFLKEVKLVKELKFDIKEVMYCFFRQGKSIEEIVKECELVFGIIVGYLEYYVCFGEVKIEQLVVREKIMKIICYVQVYGSDKGLMVIKVVLGDDVLYVDIRLVFVVGIKQLY